jgi:hypothetical protein
MDDRLCFEEKLGFVKSNFSAADYKTAAPFKEKVDVHACMSLL